MSNQSKEIERLRDLLVGKTITEVNPVAGNSEGVATITTFDGSAITEFSICATDLGWWIESEKKIAHNTSNRGLYLNPRDMFNDMINHVYYGELDVNNGSDHDLFGLLEDKQAGQFGFRSRKSQREWWISEENIQGTQWANQLRETAQRKEFAEQLSLGIIPGDFEINTDGLAELFNAMAEEFKEEE